MELAVLFRGRSVLIPHDSLRRVDADVVNQVVRSCESYRDPIDALESQDRLGLITLAVATYNVTIMCIGSEIIEIGRTHFYFELS
jgi:hypothetical protein